MQHPLVFAVSVVVAAVVDLAVVVAAVVDLAVVVDYLRNIISLYL